MTSSPSWPPPIHSVPPGDVAQGLVAQLEAQAADWLDAYSNRLLSRPPLDEKVVNDAVWGSVRLYPWEVAVADSPLLQRLRRIRQLGVIHWVYPNAGHSRFEHSVGVTQAVQVMLDGLERNSGSVGRPVVDDATCYLVRLAALVHDTGHTLMSHVTESLVAELEGVAELRAWLQEQYNLRKAPCVSEAFAAVFVRSPAFRRLLDVPSAGADFFRSSDAAASEIAGLLLGGPVFQDRPYLSLVVNGPFDADKLDYMQRDALMSGVPCALDVSRLAQKLKVVEVPHGVRADEFKEHRNWARCKDGEPLRLLAIAQSATSVLEELASSRATLFAKVYFHQKVRAAEAVVQDCLSKENRSVREWLALVDEDIYQFGGAAALHERTLPKRALYFSAPSDDAPLLTRAWRKLTNTTRNPDKARRFRKMLLEKSREAACILGQDLTALERSPPMLDLPPEKKLDLGAFLGDTAADVALAKAGVAGQRSEAGKMLERKRGFVYGPEENLDAVFFAAAHLFQSEFGLLPDVQAISRTNLDPRRVEEGAKRLDAQAFFGVQKVPEVLPTLHATEPLQRRDKLERFLRTAISRIVSVSESLGRYQSQDGVPVSTLAIAEYLRQFGTVERARVALRILEQIDFKDRAFFMDKLRLAAKAASDGRANCIAVPLGSTGDSSAMLSYLMGDIGEDKQLEVRQLELALENESCDAILLWDDFCGAGGHTITTLAQWLSDDQAVEDEILKEKLALPLSSKRQQRLRELPVYLGYALATDSGISAVQTALRRLGLSNVQVLSTHETVQPTNELLGNGTCFRTETEQHDFFAFARDKAKDIHRSKVTRARDPWTQEVLEERLLGHGNWSKLLVFFYNVPTVTLTILWGGAEGAWRPLLPRRNKPRVG